jgi:hypothetical protein
MIFKQKTHIPNYDSRSKRLDNNPSYERLLSEFIKIEPHTLYNMGHFIDFIKGSEILGKVLSIGIDPMKEFILIKECNFKQIDVYDIDRESVEEGNRFWGKKSINIKYFCKNILDEEINDNYSTILLFQMDYIFSDIEMSLILKKIKQSGISNCYFITPSLINVNNKKPIRVFIHDFFYLFFNLIYRYRNKKKLYSISNECLFTYERTKSHLIKLFNNFQFIVSKEKVIINQNGSFNFFHFRLNNNNISRKEIKG